MPCPKKFVMHPIPEARVKLLSTLKYAESYGRSH